MESAPATQSLSEDLRVWTPFRILVVLAILSAVIGSFALTSKYEGNYRYECPRFVEGSAYSECLDASEKKISLTYTFAFSASAVLTLLSIFLINDLRSFGKEISWILMFGIPILLLLWLSAVTGDTGGWILSESDIFYGALFLAFFPFLGLLVSTVWSRLIKENPGWVMIIAIAVLITTISAFVFVH